MKWTQEELSTLRARYESARCGADLRLDDLATTLGRDKANICRKARELGLTHQGRNKVLERKPRPAPQFASDTERRAATGQRMKAWIATNGHPRGAAGMRHTDEAKALISEGSKRAWADPNSKLNSEDLAERKAAIVYARIRSGRRFRTFSRGKGGKRQDLGDVYFRSSWEANYARYLNWAKGRGLILAWAYESRTFEFEGIKRGTRFYTPDFEVTLPDGKVEWHEVKGWMNQQSRTRLARMARYFPDEVVRLIDKAWFSGAIRQGLDGIIPNWEKDQKR